MEKVWVEQMAEYFIEALGEVVSTMAGFETHVVPCKQTGQDIEIAIGHQIVGAMVLHGERDALVSLSMTENAASMIIAYMTGTLPDALEKEELFDGAAELVNMMAGRVKVKVAGTPCYFHLTSPFAIGGDNLSIRYKQGLPAICRRLTAGELELILKIVYL